MNTCKYRRNEDRRCSERTVGVIPDRPEETGSVKAALCETGSTNVTDRIGQARKEKLLAWKSRFLYLRGRSSVIFSVDASKLELNNLMQIEAEAFERLCREFAKLVFTSSNCKKVWEIV